MRFQHIHHADQAAIDEMYGRYRPVFVLTTGRSGSRWIADLLSQSPRLAAFHEPPPTLQYFAHWASRQPQETGERKRVIDAARMEMVLQAMIQDRVYVESNQCLTFFAPALAELFRSCRFVHLLRHPGDFVSSAVRKGWYRNDSIWEAGRPRPVDDPSWPTRDPVDQLGWLWTETNRFIAGFLAGLDADRGCTCRLEDLTASPERVQELFSFCGVEPAAPSLIEAIQSRPSNRLVVGPDEPSNMKKLPGFPGYADWPRESRDRLRRRAGELAGRYGYSL